ncbi:hypothetical protein [Paenibacillus oryzisoli]|uniref:Uncharacterized protein n=1 Tax=Paenibacillus oryzisoli TaxID=1850517 RepID=A0A198A4H5_9BACL|nr:hypothetical protein [Paenibacillus oryzisoli]OAS16050.1 hypothetical protein A8708_05590 [Paenibacillus oryzisoli]
MKQAMKLKNIFAERLMFSIVLFYIQMNDHWDAECDAKLLLDEWDGLPDASPQDNYWILSQLVLCRNVLAKHEQDELSSKGMWGKE